LRYIGQTESGKDPGARDLVQVLIAIALGSYRVTVSMRYWREDRKIVVKPTPVKKTPTIDGQGPGRQGLLTWFEVINYPP
jgi:hypothetical protein